MHLPRAFPEQQRINLDSKIWFVLLQHGPGLQGPLMKLMGQLHMATSNISLQRQMLMAAAHTQLTLQAAQYSQTVTQGSLSWGRELILVGLLCRDFQSCEQQTA